MTTATNAFSSDLLFPVYFKYQSQSESQPAYITLDLESGVIDADYNGAVGNAVNSRVWHGIVLRWTINPKTSSSTLSAMINENLAFFQSILDAAEVVWDGNNHVGRVSLDIESDWEKFLDGDLDGGVVDSFEDWIYDHRFPSEGQALDDYIKEIHSFDGADGWYFSTEKSSIEEVRNMIFDFWAEYLYCDNDLPKEVAAALLADGRCAGSQWIEELTAFANQSAEPVNHDTI